MTSRSSLPRFLLQCAAFGLAAAFLIGLFVPDAGPRLRARLQWLLNDEDAQVRAEAFDGLLKLAEPEGPAGDIDLAHVNWGNYDLVVIDESHNFRN